MSGSLPVVLAHRLAERSEECRWLIEELWADEGVGIVGGEPKCCKSFLALDMAVAVASGTPCLRRYAVPTRGPVLLYAAEDALHVVRHRLQCISRAAGVALESNLSRCESIHQAPNQTTPAQWRTSWNRFPAYESERRQVGLVKPPFALRP